MFKFFSTIGLLPFFCVMLAIAVYGFSSAFGLPLPYTLYQCVDGLWGYFAFYVVVMLIGVFADAVLCGRR